MKVTETYRNREVEKGDIGQGLVRHEKNEKVRGGDWGGGAGVVATERAGKKVKVKK